MYGNEEINEGLNDGSDKGSDKGSCRGSGLRSHTSEMRREELCLHRDLPSMVALLSEASNLAVDMGKEETQIYGGRS